MYTPPTFLTMGVLQGILAEFTWPAPYTLENELPDGIWMIFPGASIEFCEGFESEMYVRFSSEDTGVHRDLKLFHALHALASDPGRMLPAEPRLIRHFSPGASLEKVQNGLRDLCTLVLTYLTPYLLGDRSWVEAYRRQHPEPG